MLMSFSFYISTYNLYCRQFQFLSYKLIICSAIKSKKSEDQAEISGVKGVDFVSHNLKIIEVYIIIEENYRRAN